ncbi:LuxR C-terminal-related transcriptional regulator [Devosia sp. A16]|uniref:LuxR C-terminal-related transcriptional regulator n=1 Tax=Devosia sp. A16 TaxID=1736675 RepID=UPI0006D7CD60|nr:LuxR C-terminal-related transcriptional regulator [Devosia sp. A16]
MSLTRSRGRPRYADSLTPAEWRVANAIRHGGTDRTISQRLGISSDAVKFHVGNILGKLGLADRRALRQWTGVPLASALGQRQQRGDDMSELAKASAGNEVRWGTIGQLARSVRDIAAAEAWYRDVLQLPHLYTFGNLAFFDCGGTRLMLSAGERAGADEYVIYFRVPDIHAAHLELQQRGAAFKAAPHMIHRHADGTEEWMAFFADNEDRLLAIMCQVPPA